MKLYTKAVFENIYCVENGWYELDDDNPEKIVETEKDYLVNSKLNLCEILGKPIITVEVIG